MRLVNPQVDKERLLFAVALFDERARVVGVFMNGHLLSGTVERSVCIVTINSRYRGVRYHVIRKVPLSEVRSSVTSFLQHAREKGSIWIEPVGHAALRVTGHPSEMAIDVVTGGEVAGHHGGAAGRADAAGHREAVKVRALASEPIDIGRLRIRMFAQCKVVQVVNRDEQDIRSVRG